MGYSTGSFSEIGSKITPNFLLQFLIHIDVLVLCRKFEVIPTKTFRVMTILKNGLIFENYPVL